MASNSDFKFLLLQIISGEISAEDRERFYDMINDEGKGEEFTHAFEELGEERSELYEAYEFKASEWDEMKKSILNKNKKIYKIPVYKKGWFRAAAIVLIFSLGLSVYVEWKIKQKQNEISQIRIKPLDVAPASNKAVLTLSTGQQIILDSAKNGQLAKFGNTTISKTDSGKLLYASDGSKPTSAETQLNTLTTPRGGIYELTLPDGTQAWLNAASRIDYPTRFTGKKREVFISGEVYFEVAKDAAHPFLVSLAAKTRSQGEMGHWLQIEVLGTHFNVNAYEDNKNNDPNTSPNLNPTRTTLLEGSIKISAGNESKLIKPGEQAIAGFGSKGIDINQKVDIDKVMAWRYGKMALTDVSVQQLMSEISRWYDVDVEYAGAVPDKQFYGSIRRDVPLSTVLHALEAYGVITKIDGKKIIVQ